MRVFGAGCGPSLIYTTSMRQIARLWPERHKSDPAPAAMHALVPVAASLVLGAVLGVVCWVQFSTVLPHHMSNQTEWRLLEAEVLAAVDARSAAARVGLLLALHTAHIYLCVPMLHLTKVAYGAWLGLGPGWLLCCAWELLLFAAYLACMPRSPAPVVQRFTRSSRAAGRLFFDNCMLAASSFPLHVSASLVLGGDVSAPEFMAANALTTSVLTLKNVGCGAVLAATPSPTTLLLLAAVLSVSTVMPIFATLYMTSHGLFLAAEPAAAPQAPPPAVPRPWPPRPPQALAACFVGPPCAHGEDEKLCPTTQPR